MASHHECTHCHQIFTFEPYYYYRDTRERHEDRIPFCSTLCIQDFKGTSAFRNYRIIDLDRNLDEYRRKFGDRGSGNQIRS